MLNNTERNNIVEECLEKMLLKLPEIVGNLIQHQVMMNKINMEFFSQHPEYRDHADIVTKVVQKTEGLNTLMNYHDILNRAVPEIDAHIKTLKSLNVKDVQGLRRLNAST